ncbi:MAG: hypothetical protein JW751_27230 [Polyangiaceae bacterium]|nr:hypothetical protein [Polyangiaceae bacterium]
MDYLSLRDCPLEFGVPTLEPAYPLPDLPPAKEPRKGAPIGGAGRQLAGPHGVD